MEFKDIPRNVLKNIFRDPTVTYGDIFAGDLGKGVFCLTSDDQSFMVKPLDELKLSQEEYRRRYDLLHRAYSGKVKIRPGSPRFFTFNSPGYKEKVTIVVHPWVSGREIKSAYQFQMEFSPAERRDLLSGLAWGEKLLTELVCQEESNPFKDKWVGKYFPALIRSFALSLKLMRGSLKKEWYFNLLSFFVVFFNAIPLFLLELLALLIKGQYYDQSNAEPIISRFGVIYSPEDAAWYLLEVKQAGAYPYPGKNLAKVARYFLPSSPTRMGADLGFCVRLTYEALTELDGAYFPGWSIFRRLGLIAGFLVHLFVQLVESMKDNQWHIVPKEELKGKFYFFWLWRTIRAFFLWYFNLPLSIGYYFLFVWKGYEQWREAKKREAKNA